MTADSVDTPATTARSVRAATEYLAVYEEAPGIYLVDNGKTGDDHEQYTVDPSLPACTCEDWEYRSDELGDDGCKHIRRCRMERGEIDVTPLLETDLDLDPLLLEAIDAGAGADESAASPAVADGGLPEYLTELSTIDGDAVVHCETCGSEGDRPDDVDHHAGCLAVEGDR
jgi:hypothetical protein